MPRNTGRREGDPAKPPFAEAKKRGGTFEGWRVVLSPERPFAGPSSPAGGSSVCKETTMDDRIKIITRKNRYGNYVSTIRVNGEFYAEVSCADRETAIAEATHYAALIEFDEFGNW